MAVVLVSATISCTDTNSDEDTSGAIAATPTTAVDGDPGLRPLALFGDFIECFMAEAPDVEPLGVGLRRRLQALRELDPEDAEVRKAVRACFPGLAAAFVDAGLRPPTQGELAISEEPATSAPGAPALNGDFADPFLLSVGAEEYVYATNTLGQNVPAARFGGPGEQSQPAEALPQLPEWTEAGTVWAPSVAEVEDGYALYYTTRHRDSGLQCISVATADDPLGPFVDGSDGPIVCDVELGGSIDPSPYGDGERTWLVWKSDGNCCGMPTTIWVQETSADGTALLGEPAELLGVDQAWEGELVEGPSLVDVGDELLLFYSANRWDTTDYAVGYALCDSITGPCTKPQDTPWLFTYEHAAGPGGQELAVGPDSTRVVYHGWSPGAVGYDNGGMRRLYVEPVHLETRPPGLDFTP